MSNKKDKDQINLEKYINAWINAFEKADGYIMHLDSLLEDLVKDDEFKDIDTTESNIDEQPKEEIYKSIDWTKDINPGSTIIIESIKDGELTRLHVLETTVKTMLINIFLNKDDYETKIVKRSFLYDNFTLVEII